MPNSIIAGSVRCPFYISDSTKPGKLSITCEGHNGCEKLRSVFDSYDQLDEQVKQFCSRAFEGCPIFEIVNRKYE